MPSPPFIDYDPDNDKFSNSSEWEYDHDDYWDHDAPRQGKRNNAREYTAEINNGPKKKRRRVDRMNDIPGPSLEGHSTAVPTVIWKSKYDLHSPEKGPIVRPGQGEKVALLKDWKERFKYQPNLAASQPQSKRSNKKGSQIATAVLIGDGSPESYDSTTLPPTKIEKATSIPSRSRVFPSIPEQNGPVVNGTIPHTTQTDLTPRGGNSNRLVRNTTMAGKKRTLEELSNHEENELPTPKKRLGTPTKKTPNNPQLSKQPLANKTNSSIPASRKRKVDDSDNQAVTSPRKRTDTARTKGVEASAAEGNGSPVRRTTRTNR